VDAPDRFEVAPLPPFMVRDGELVALEVDSSIYSTAALLRACYKFTDRCYFFVTRAAETPHRLVVVLWQKGGRAPDLDLIGQFSNELCDQQVREQLDREAGALRELIVAQAFAEGNLLNPETEHADYEADPLSIASSR
jgi:His-Xaa-Ser system protein HxsD